MQDGESHQWTMAVSIYHGPGFGHRLELTVLGKRPAAPHKSSLGSWKGLGVPEPVLHGASARVLSVLEEHLITRYGIQGELPVSWAGEPDPF